MYRAEECRAVRGAQAAACLSATPRTRLDTVQCVFRLTRLYFWSQAVKLLSPLRKAICKMDARSARTWRSREVQAFLTQSVHVFRHPRLERPRLEATTQLGMSVGIPLMKMMCEDGGGRRQLGLCVTRIIPNKNTVNLSLKDLFKNREITY